MGSPRRASPRGDRRLLAELLRARGHRARVAGGGDCPRLPDPGFAFFAGIGCKPLVMNDSHVSRWLCFSDLRGAAVNEQLATSDEAGVVGGQEECRRGNLLGP